MSSIDNFSSFLLVIFVKNNAPKKNDAFFLTD